MVGPRPRPLGSLAVPGPAVYLPNVDRSRLRLRSINRTREQFIVNDRLGSLGSIRRDVGPYEPESGTIGAQNGAEGRMARWRDLARTLIRKR